MDLPTFDQLCQLAYSQTQGPARQDAEGRLMILTQNADAFRFIASSLESPSISPATMHFALTSLTKMLTNFWVAIPPPDRVAALFDIIECCLFVCYASELALRVMAFGLKGFTKPWIVFDSILVIIGSIFYIVSYSTDIALDPGASSSLRIIRIARVSFVHHKISYGKSIIARYFSNNCTLFQ